jgi:hypothetical protein
MTLTTLDTPITVKRSHQPNESETWEITSHEPVVAGPKDAEYIKNRAASGWVVVRGRVLDSHVTSRLFTASSTKHTAEAVLHDHMPAKYLVDGATYITVAM